MSDWRSFYEGIILSEEEIKEAILQGKIAKYFREKHAPYWEEKMKIMYCQCGKKSERIGDPDDTDCASCKRMKRKFATAKIPDDPKPIAKQSEDMKRIMPIYLRNKKRFLRGKKCAVMPHLDAVDVHHSAGRGIDSYYDEWSKDRGICLLLDERFWVPVSREGHIEIENRPEWAKLMNFSEDRLIPTKMRNENIDN